MTWNHGNAMGKFVCAWHLQNSVSGPSTVEGHQGRNCINNSYHTDIIVVQGDEPTLSSIAKQCNAMVWYCHSNWASIDLSSLWIIAKSSTLVFGCLYILTLIIHTRFLSCITVKLWVFHKLSLSLNTHWCWLSNI